MQLNSASTGVKKITKCVEIIHKFIYTIRKTSQTSVSSLVHGHLK